MATVYELQYFDAQGSEIHGEPALEYSEFPWTPAQGELTDRETQFMAQAVSRGASSYVAKALRPQKINDIIEAEQTYHESLVAEGRAEESPGQVLLFGVHRPGIISYGLLDQILKDQESE